MNPGSHILRVCSRLIAFLFGLSQMYQTGGSSTLLSVQKIEQCHRMSNQASKVDGGHQSYCFWSEIPSEKGSVAGHTVMMHQPFPLFPNFGLSFLYFFIVVTK